MRFGASFFHNALAFVLFAAGVWPVVVVAQTISGKTPADWPAGMTSPIAIPLPPGDWGTGGIVAALRVGPRAIQRVTAQYEPADPLTGTPARAWIMWAAGPVDRGQPVTVEFERTAPAQSLYTSRYNDPLLTVTPADGQPILTYYQGKPEGGQRFPLTDYIHPLVGLDGEPLTTLRPQDHEHHRGVFWAWVRHERDDKSIGDWWVPIDTRLDPGPLQHNDGPILSRFAAEHIWVFAPKTGQSEPYISEHVVGRVFPTTHQGRIVDVDITLTPLIDKLRIGGTLEQEKGYGGFTFRYAQAIEPIIVADGKRVSKDINQLRAAWADYSGTFLRRPGQPNTERTGAAVFVDPHNPDFPPEWITRFYGVLNVSYPGLRMLDLVKGKPLRLHYRIWIHRGDATDGQVDAAYKAFAADWHWMTPAATQSAPAR